MTMVCDRCGEAFPLSNDVKYMTPFDDELDQFESNSIVKCLAGDDKGIYSIRDETVVLCPSCMAALNDWLKGEQKRVRKFQTFCPRRKFWRSWQKKRPNWHRLH
nr:MAG TPA: zinc-ribbon domain protein [Caudoviricetes sp.]